MTKRWFCIDFAAHSNYLELALRELGEFAVFPHAGVSTQMWIQGKQIFPLTTGTFGGVDLVSLLCPPSLSLYF